VKSNEMAVYECTICGYKYNPEVGDTDNGISAGVPFADLPEDWVCPLCGAGKDAFVEVAETNKEASNKQTEIKTKEYRNQDLIVYWFPNDCSHAGKCWRDLPEVFKPEAKPWVNLSAAGAEEIMRTIDKCPTGALKYDLAEGSSVDPSLADGIGSIHYRIMNPNPAKIRAIKNGPLLIEGDVHILDFSGEITKETSRAVMCRCGMSGNQPFCDGAHARNNWKE